MKVKYNLVCPAGSLETLKVAIRNGATSVYLGVEGFNARSKAGFSREDFISAIEFAHLYGVKIFVTLNILIKDSEIDSVLELADFVYTNGADSIIVQDLGLYYILKNRFDADIHLSTQAGIHNLYGAIVAKNKLKANHVVLSRETLLSEIREIKDNTGLNLEFFVHGALCVSFSGNCYYSAMLTGGSGNRGTCFQFCRKKYQFLSQEEKAIKEGYLLSPSDISMLNDLQKLIEAGITHFKIEGRNRRTAYVGGVTRIYSQALKGVYSNGYKETLRQLYNRGEYNNLYLNGMNDVINTEYNNHIGIEIGEITKVVPGKFYEIYFTSDRDIENEDMLKVFDKERNEICTATVNDLTKLGNHEYMMTTINNKLKKGYKLNLICDKSLESQINEVKKYLYIDIKFNAFKGEKALLTIDYDDIHIDIEGDNILSEAKNQPLTKESAFIQLSKLGGTVFKIKNYQFETDNVFISLSEINNMRRQAVTLLKNKIIEKNTPHISQINKTLPELKRNDDEMIICEIKNELPIIKVDKIILSLSEFNDKLKEKVEKVIKSGNKAFITLPTIARGKDFDKINEFIFSYTPEQIGLVSNNLYGLFYIDSGYEVIAGEYMNVYNSYAVQYLKELGVSEVILSPEITRRQAIDICDGAVKIYGDMNYMCFAHCPKRTLYSSCDKCDNNILLRDEKDSVFEIRTYKFHYCYNYLNSNNTLNLIGEIKPKKCYIKLDENNLECYIKNKKFTGTKNKKFTYGLFYKEDDCQ